MNRFADAMKLRTDAELIATSTGSADDWEPDAIAAAVTSLRGAR
jgi:hypothetical protein